jgi:hypothetical protein
MWNFFGYAVDNVKNRDYSNLARDIAVPTDVLVGELALDPQRPLETWPSFTSEADRALLKTNPHVTLRVGPKNSGHGLVLWPETEETLHKFRLNALLKAAETISR